MTKREQYRLALRIERMKKEIRKNQLATPERVKNALRLLRRVSR